VAKTIFATPVFSAEKKVFSTDWQKPANPDSNQTRYVNFYTHVGYFKRHSILK